MRLKILPVKNCAKEKTSDELQLRNKYDQRISNKLVCKHANVATIIANSVKKNLEISFFRKGKFIIIVSHIM